MTTSVLVPVSDPSQVAEARRAVAALCLRAGFDDSRTSDASIVATELATNLVKHARGGSLIAQYHNGPVGAPALEIMTVDKGPGIQNLGQSYQDGYSTAGSPGNGLGAIRRIATEFDAFTVPGQGTVVLARICPRRPPARAQVPHEFCWSGVSVPVHGETVCGDRYALRPYSQGLLVLVADGLGHGEFAADASAVAVKVFGDDTSIAPATLLGAIHDALKSTRGAAVAVAQIDAAAGLVRFAGVGNVAGEITGGDAPRRMVSHNGTAGHSAPRIAEFTYPWPTGATMVLHSDGLQSRWTFDQYPGLLGRHPATIAAVLFRDFHRSRDDATVVVVRDGGT